MSAQPDAWDARRVGMIALGMVLGAATVTAYTEHCSWTSQIRGIDPATQSYVLAEGQILHWHREGDGVLRVGPYGILGRRDLGTAPRVLILGDSYTEGFQVDDRHTFCAGLERAWNAEHPRARLTVLNRGFSGGRVPDYACLAGLDSIVHPVAVILVVDGGDFWEDTLSEAVAIAHWVDDGTHALVERLDRRGAPPGASPFATLLAQWGLRSTLSGLARTYAAVAQTHQGGRPVSSAPPDSAHVEARFARVLEAQLSALDAAWGGRVIIAYHGRGALIVGDSVQYDIPEHSAAGRRQAMLLDAIAAHHLRLYDLRPALARCYLSSHQLPNGFANSVPDQSHLNGRGHAVIAAALLRALDADTAFARAMSVSR